MVEMSWVHFKFVRDSIFKDMNGVLQYVDQKNISWIMIGRKLIVDSFVSIGWWLPTDLSKREKQVLADLFMRNHRTIYEDLW